MPTLSTQRSFLSTVSLTKRFGDIAAVRSVSIDLLPGRVHALVGENGAGKSTLIGMLSGMMQPDEGRVVIEGRDARFGSPANALRASIATVFQQSHLIAEFSVLQNLKLSLDDRSGQIGQALEVLGRLLGNEVAPTARVGSLDLGTRQLIEMSRAIARRPKLLILDEPTSLIDTMAASRLADELRAVCEHGTSVLLVTHKLGEIAELADDISVMRQGSVVLQCDAADARTRRQPIESAVLLEAMFGSAPERDAALSGSKTIHDAAFTTPNDFVFDRVSTAPSVQECALSDVSFTVRSGEILGVAGIAGNGQEHLTQVISGDLRAQSGRLLMNGREITRMNIRNRIKMGIRTVTDDRFGAGVIPALSVATNILIERLGLRPFWNFSLTSTSKVREYADQHILDHDIRVSGASAPASTLSGGNAQKLLLTRVPLAPPRVTLYHQPTHGLDAKTVALVHDAMRAAAADGQAVLVISTDLDEVVALSDRVIVLSRGVIVATVEGQREDTRARIAAAIVGVVA